MVNDSMNVSGCRDQIKRRHAGPLSTHLEGVAVAVVVVVVMIGIVGDDGDDGDDVDDDDVVVDSDDYAYG